MKKISFYVIVNNLYELVQLCIGIPFFLAGMLYMIKHNSVDMISWVMVTLGGACVLWTIASVTLGRKFDKYFADKLEEDPDFCFRMAITMRLPPKIVGKFRSVRVVIYCREIILRRNLKDNANMDSCWFGDFDFRKNANIFEIAVSYLVLIFTVLFVSTAFWPFVESIYAKF